ncbi:uncharacterized protein LOC129322419 [Prosopis cineraria]|uniref:uncharacterized protein LOC129322419 n=1 Tax=Prosopis cineraria TaxID=364024 RepID=UPI0024104B9A|nr:uncharacterized protein LOC129322419 [Prosopis cineraria]
MTSKFLLKMDAREIKEGFPEVEVAAFVRGGSHMMCGDFDWSYRLKYGRPDPPDIILYPYKSCADEDGFAHAARVPNLSKFYLSFQTNFSRDLGSHHRHQEPKLYLKEI